MSAPTPEQAAFEAFQASRAQRRPMMAVTAWTHPAVDEAREDWRAAVKAGAADVTAERDALRAQLAEVLAWFGNNGSGHYARVSGTILAREYKRANLPLPDSLKHLAGQ